MRALTFQTCPKQEHKHLACFAANSPFKCSPFMFKCFYSILKIYNFRNIVHFLKRILQVVDDVLAKCIVIFRKRSTQSEFLDVFYCDHATYQMWAWFEEFKRNVNQTNTVNFDAHWTSGAKKGGFEISLATDLYSCCS